MDKKTICGLGLAAVLALSALAVWLIPVGYGMTALTLVFCAAVVAFYTLARHRKTLIKWVSIALCLCIGLFLAAEIPVYDGSFSDADTDADFLVVMGAGINGTEPSLSMLDRLEAALDWLEAHPDSSVIVSGSKAPDELMSEAAVMAAWLEGQGIAPERILLDELSDDSRENIVNSYTLAAKNGGGRVAFVSSEYHLCRMRMIIRSLGFEPVCVAAQTSRVSLRINYFIREAFAVWQIWVFGAQA